MSEEARAESGGVFTDADGVRRRTLIAGAAWTIPVIAVATASPATAATNDLKLAFDKSSYSGTGCETIKGAYVTATRGGSAASGESVTVTLADGYTFDGGSTTYTGTTGTDGRLNLPAINVPQKGGDSTFSATSGSASTSAPVTGAEGGQAIQVKDKATNSTKVPNGATPLNAGYFLQGTTLYFLDGTVVASDVAATSTGYYADGQGNGNYINYRTSDGKLYQAEGTKSTAASKIPDGATPLNAGYFLKSSTLYFIDGTKIATNVAATSDGYYAVDQGNGGNFINYRDSDGKLYQATGNTSTAASKIPDGATPLDAGYFLNDGVLYFIDGTEVAKDVAATSTGYYASGQGTNSNFINYRDKSGKAYQVDATKATAQSKVPDGATPLDAGYFLKDNVLYFVDGTKVAENVAATSTGYYAKDYGNYVDIRTSKCS